MLLLVVGLEELINKQSNHQEWLLNLNDSFSMFSQQNSWINVPPFFQLSVARYFHWNRIKKTYASNSHPRSKLSLQDPNMNADEQTVNRLDHVRLLWRVWGCEFALKEVIMRYSFDSLRLSPNILQSSETFFRNMIEIVLRIQSCGGLTHSPYIYCLRTIQKPDKIQLLGKKKLT